MGLTVCLSVTIVSTDNNLAIINKINSTAGAVQVETNLQEWLRVHLHFKNLKCCLKRQVFKVISRVSLDLTVSEILKSRIFNLKNVGQGHDV